MTTIVVKKEEQTASPEMIEAVTRFVDLCYESMGEAPPRADTAMGAAAVAMQTLIHAFGIKMAQVAGGETPPDRLDGRPGCVSVIHGIGCGVAAYFQDASPEVGLALAADLIAGLRFANQPIEKDETVEMFFAMPSGAGMN